MKLYRAEETAHPGVFAVWQTDAETGGGFEVAAHIQRIRLESGSDLHYIKAGRPEDALHRARYLLPRPFASLADALAHVEAMVKAGTVSVYRPEQGER